MSHILQQKVTNMRNMQVVKLDRRYKAFHRGFTHAISAPSYSAECHAVCKAFEKMYGFVFSKVFSKSYCKFTVSRPARYYGSIPDRYTYYAVRNEEMLTSVLMLIQRK